jgi:acetyl esterase/lipase
VVVFFYGGSWQNGRREDYYFAGAGLAAKGFVAMLPDYRKYPQVVFPGFLEDGAMAVAWAKRNAARFGGDPSRVFLMGHSAGAHIAAMLSLDARYLGAQGLAPKDLAGLVGLAGPYDFLPLRDPILKTIFAPEATIARTQPITFVAAGAPPAFLATGADDTTVNPRNTVNLAAKMRASGVSVLEKRYEGLNHYTLIGALGEPLRSRHPVFEDVIAFLKAASAGP